MPWMAGFLNWRYQIFQGFQRVLRIPGIVNNILNPMTPPRILIVGAGITGAAVSRYLTNILPAAALQLTVWEAQSNIGGRMLEHKHTPGSSARCDLGAQYISRDVSGRGGYDNEIYCTLEHAGVLLQLKDNSQIFGMRPEHLSGKHFIAPSGTSSIVSSLLSNVVVHKSTALIDLQLLDRGGIQATDQDGCHFEYDIVVITAPAPNILKILESSRLKSSISRSCDNSLSVPDDIVERLDMVSYSSRFALAVYYRLSPEEKELVLGSVPWKAKYVLDDDVVRYVSIENFKYEQTDSQPSAHSCALNPAEHSLLSVLVHTSVPFGLAHMELLHSLSAQIDHSAIEVDTSSVLDGEKDRVVEVIMSHVFKENVLPLLAQFVPKSVRLIGWEQSQVSRSYHAARTGAEDPANSRGCLSQQDADGELRSADPPALMLPQGHKAGPGTQSPLPLLVLAGDAFTESNFDGCLRSAKYAAKAIAQAIHSRDPVR